MPIRRLPPLLVNQIAAGEVIERPASVIKELVENSIDAGSTRIEVAIEEGGKALIRVTDDGVGVPADELELALAPHATSKIAESTDLDIIATMGFRGEALASIASVSRLSFLSRTQDQERGAVIEGEGDELQGPRPAASAPGTTVTVRNLFFNTPARRKFLKADQTESGRINEMLQRLALAHPSVGFTYRTERGVRWSVPDGQDARRRVLAVLGGELVDELLEIEGSATDDSLRMWALAGTPDVARATKRHLHVFLNGRPISDRTVHHAIVEAYRGLIEPGRWPTIVLFLEIDPGSVDVNVHPAKAEVRFRRPNDVHHIVHATLRDGLRAADLTPPMDLARAMPSRSAAAPVFGTGHVAPDLRPAAPTGSKGIEYRELKETLADTAPAVLPTSSSPTPLPMVRQATTVLQLHSSYLVTEDEDGLLIVDQHALHERVMFERLRERVEHGTLESQRLLTPVTIPVDAGQMEALGVLQPLLVKLGIEAEPMGPSTIGVHAFTSLLFERKVDPVVFMNDLLARVQGEGLPTEPEAAVHEVLDMMACKAAVKAGDRLEPAEMADLLAQRERVERSSNCPHGRPTTLRITLHDLERQFGRR